MTEPNGMFLDGVTPTVELAGKMWPVPLLTPRQNRHVTPAILKLGPKLNSAAIPANQTVRSAFSGLDEEGYGMLLTAAYWSLKRAHPSMTFDEFEDMEITTTELMIALPILARQTGLIKPVAAGEAAPVGEAEAATSRLNGTTSSAASSSPVDGPGPSVRTS